MKVAYQGTIGAYSYIASKKLFPNASLQACDTFKEVVEKVVSKEILYGVLPIENSYAGEVGEVLDLLFQNDVYIQKRMNLQINHALVGLPEATKEDISTVVSHPQALEQCSKYVTEHHLKAVLFTNTALAAESIKEKGLLSEAAIASHETAKEFGLKILDDNITNFKDNTTRFIVISHEKPKGASTFAFMLTSKSGAGALAPIINLIANLNIDLSCIKSRPLKGKSWEYYFYFEASGSYLDSKVLALEESLKKMNSNYKLVGSF